MKARRAVITLVVGAVLSAGLTVHLAAEGPTGGPAMTIDLTGPAFAAEPPIPAVSSCRGADRSPPLEWSHVPAGVPAGAHLPEGQLMGYFSK